MYNVEPFVERCLLSIENQDIPKDEYEIICINDGSPDNSRLIVEQMQKEFDNIVLINQENQGVSRARNNGIDKARGKYLLFIDPDDYVDANSFAQILNNADKHLAQVSFLGYTFLNEDGHIRETVINHQYTDKVYSGLNAYRLARGNGRTDPDRTVAVLFENMLFKKNNLHYLPDVPYLEDGELIARILCLAERCIFDGNPFYQRTTRAGSATNSSLFSSDKATNGFILAANNLKRFQKEESLNISKRVFLNQPICKFILLSLISSMNNLTKFKKTKNILNSLNLGKCKLKGCNNYYYIEGALYNISPYLFLLHRRLGAPLLKLLKP